MKNYSLLTTMICFANICFAQLSVITNPAAANICAGNTVSITASATPVSYSVSAIANNPFEPTFFATTILVDQLNSTIVPVSTGTLDDGRWDNISLPFSFQFYGNIFNAVNISTNGWIGLGSTNTTTTGYGVSLPNAAAPNNVIHAISSDLTFAGAANTAVLQYFETGTTPNRRFVIDYSNISFFSGTGSADVQVILFESSNTIEIHTTSCSNTADSKAQGIENSTGTVAAFSPNRNNTAIWTAMPDGNRFTPDNINFSWTPAAGLNTTTGATVIASPVSTTIYTVTAINPSNGFSGNTTVTVTVDPASYTLAAIAGGPTVCQNISVALAGTHYRDGNCNLIASIIPAGAIPVSNSITTCITLDTGATKRGTATLYLARKYDIEPLLNPYPAISTANITLYYLQSEFTNYNTKAIDSAQTLLPTGPADAIGISNLLLRQFHGTGTNPSNYTGPAEDFTTANTGFTVTWNGARNWWEIVVPVTGFSGFYLTSKPSGTLAINFAYFKGMQINNKHLLSWKANSSSARVTFEIERSVDGQHFTTLKKITANQATCSQPFELTDDHPLAGINYYRIKSTDEDNRIVYTGIISLILKTKGFQLISISPNPVTSETAILKINAGERSLINIRISDLSGKIIKYYTALLLPGINQLALDTKWFSPGTYVVTTYALDDYSKTLKLFKL